MNRQLYEKAEKQMYSYPGLIERSSMPIAQPVSTAFISGEIKSEKKVKEPVAVETKSKTLNLKMKK
jgi:hypothetical protein